MAVFLIGCIFMAAAAFIGRESDAALLLGLPLCLLGLYLVTDGLRSLARGARHLARRPRQDDHRRTG